MLQLHQSASIPVIMTHALSNMCQVPALQIFRLVIHRLLQMVCELLLERGDYVLAEEYTYPSVIESVIIPKGYKPLGVKLDQDGICPESLLEVCSQ